MKRLNSCKLPAGADTAEILAGILGIEQTSVFLQNKTDEPQNCCARRITWSGISVRRTQ